MFHFRRVAGLAGVVVLGVAMLPGIAAAEVPAEQVPDNLKAAIEQHIEDKGHDYVGFCRDANQMTPLPAGKHCAFVLSIEHEIAEVTYAAVASDELTFFALELVNGQWQLRTDDQPYNPPVGQPSQTPTQPTQTATQPSQATQTPTRAGAIPTPRPPSTGSGSVGAPAESSEASVMLAIAGIGLALGVAGTVALRRR